MMKYKYILFDLDGTVSESAAGIRRSLEYAIETIGCPMPNLDDYTLYVGPPLIDTFLNLVGLDTETAERGAELYRSYYGEYGKLLNRTYQGIPELLKKLRAENAKLAICSSKYEPFAEEILEILGVRDCFDAVCGSNIDGSRKDKKDLIPYAVKSLGGDLERDRAEAVRRIGVARVPPLLLEPPRRRLGVGLGVHVLRAVVDIAALAVDDIAQNALLREVEHKHFVLTVHAVFEHHARDFGRLARLDVFPALVYLERAWNLHKRDLAVAHRAHARLQVPVPARAVVNDIHVG